MAYACDVCDSAEYSADNPQVRACQRRPSDHSDLCCVMWGHWLCMGGSGDYTPQFPTADNPGGALATYADLGTWIESREAAALGYCFIT